MDKNLGLKLECTNCRKPFHLAPEELVPERKSYVCPRCGTDVALTPDKEKIAIDLLNIHLAEKRES